MIATLVATSIISVSAHAHAQDIPYANYLVGDRALGLGGAFVGLAEDGSAIFHNPAGLSLVPENALSTSFWVAGLRRRNIDGGWTAPEGGSDLENTQLDFPPLVFTVVSRIGEPDDNGHTRHALGAAILKPLREDYRFAAANDAGASLSSLDVVHRDNARWYGVSYAYGLPRPRLAFGVTAFVTLRNLTHEEIEMHGQRGTPAPTPESHPLSRHSLFSATLRDMVWRFGVTWDPMTCWRIGIMAQLPGISLGGPASNRQITLDVDAAGDMTTERIAHDDLRAWRKIPWEVRVGATRFLGRHGLITVDAAIHGGVGNERSPSLLIRDATVPKPLMLANESYLSPSVRVAIGGEYVYRDRYPLRGGMLVYSSGTPAVPAQSNRPSVADVSTVGWSVSGGLVLPGGQHVQIGSALIHSFGRASALQQDLVGPASYTATGMSDTTLLLFISGGIGGAKVLLEEGEKWLEEQQQNPDGEPPTGAAEESAEEAAKEAATDSR